MDGRGISGMRFVARRWGLLGLLCVAAWLPGCAAGGATPAPEPPPVEPPRPWRLDDLTGAIFDNAWSWQTLEAQCRVQIYSPSIGGRDNKMTLDGGQLHIFKRLRRATRSAVEEAASAGGVEKLVVAPVVMLRMEFPGRMLVIGNGELYKVEIPELEEEFWGDYGAPPLGAKIPLTPEDLANSIEPAAALTGLALMLKQEGPALEILMLGLDKATPAGRGAATGLRLQLKRSLVLQKERGNELPIYLFQYERDGAPRASVKITSYTEVKGDGGRPVSLPSGLWIGYPEQRAYLEIRLSDVRLNVRLNPQSFELRATTR